MYLFLSRQHYDDCSADFNIEFWSVDGVGVVGVDSEDYTTYLSISEIEQKEPSNSFDFYHFKGNFKPADIDEIISNNYLSCIDGYQEVDETWKCGLRFDDYTKGEHYFSDELEKDAFVRKILNEQNLRRRAG